MRKKLFTLFLALVTSVGTICAWDYERVQIGDLYYNLSTSTLTAAVTYKSYSGSETIYGNSEYNKNWYIVIANIPKSVYYNGKTYSVTGIGSDAFRDCSCLTSVTIPNSVTSIGAEAFYGCIRLTSVTIPNSITSIGARAFFDCTGMTSAHISDLAAWCNITFYSSNSNPLSYAHHLYLNDTEITDLVIPNSVTSIGDYAFSGCSGLTNMTIPNSVTSIGQYAISSCSSLTNITIPNSVTSIGQYAFSGCSGLTNITIPNSVTSIGGSAFNDCSSLTSVTLNSDAIVSKTYTYSYLKNIFGSQVTEYIIGNEVTGIGDYAFSDCSGLTSVTIPNSVTSIGNSAFSGCSGLTSIDIPNSVTSIGNYAFSGCSGLTSIDIPNSVTSIEYYAFKNCTGLTSVTIPNSVTSIGQYAFSGCSGLTSVTIPNSVTSIGQYAFSSCSGLTSVTINSNYIINKDYSSDSTIRSIFGSQVQKYIIGEHVTCIGSYVFYKCSSLTSVIIPESVTRISANAFNGCSGLTNVIIPNTVTSIGSDAFLDCTGLTSVTWNAKNCSSPSNYSSAPFYAIRSKIKSFVFGDEIEIIPAYLCYGMTKLTSVNIPNSVTSIGQYAFSSCSSLTSVTINSNYIINKNYSSDSSIRSIFGSQVQKYIIGEHVTCIGYYAFSGCSGLTNITIPNSVTSIRQYAFSGCSGLTDITIPNSVTSIGNYAFSGCSGLTSVHISDLAAWCRIQFYEDNSNPLGYAHHLYLNDIEITDLVIPESVTSIGDYAFSGCSGLTSVSIPNSIRSIRHEAFVGCDGMTSVHISDLAAWCKITFSSSNSNPLSYAHHLYLNDTEITDLVIPNSVTSIGDYAFYGCIGLTNITISESVTSIGNGAFHGTGLTSVAIPNRVTSIGQDAFSDCSSLTSIYVPCQDKERFLQLLNNDQRIKGSTTTMEYTNLIELLSDRQKGTIVIVEEPNDCDSLITISAVPNRGYSFVKWTDGNTEAQRNIKLKKESQTFGAIFRIETTNLSYLATGGTDFGEMTTDNSSVWRYNSQYGAYASKSGGVSGNLFTPAKDMSKVTSVSLSFQHTHKFAGTPSEELTLWVTKDFKGSWDESEWQQLTISPYASNTNWIFVSVSMNVPTAYVGKNTVFAFRYKSTASNYGTWEIKNLKITVIGRDQYEIADMSNQTQGHIAGSGLHDYLSSVELTATPEYGFHFVQWSDGVTDNTRTIVLMQDTSFCAEFAFDKSGTCGDDNLLTWKYDAETKLLTVNGEGTLNSNYSYGVEAPTQAEELIIGSGVTSIGDEAFNGISSLKSVQIPNSVTTIGNSAFENCSSLETLSLGENITKYGEKAFAGCPALTSIYNYRKTPAKLGAEAFKDVDYFNCTLYVLAGSVDMYKSSGSDWKDFYFVEPISAESAPADIVVVVPHDNSADISWPKVADAETYELKITKDGEVFCVLTFNTQGQLVSIAFAPSRYNAAEQAQAAGFSFTVTGLSSGTQYGYSITASNSAEETLDTKSGSFMTTTDGKVSTFDVTFIVKDNETLQHTIADVPYGTTLGDLIEMAKAAVGGDSFEDDTYIYTFAGVEGAELTDIVTESTTYYLLYTKTEKSPTSIIDAESATPVQKIIRDDKVFILREGKTFTIQGHEIK